MACIAKLTCAGVAIVILFANLHGVFSTSVPASPAVLPYAKNIYAPNPNVSSFFPNSSSNSPNAEVPSSSSNSPNAEVPSSGEFVGKVSSANSNRAAAAAGLCIQICCFLFDQISCVVTNL